MMFKKLLILSYTMITVSAFAMLEKNSNRDHEKVMTGLDTELASGLTEEEIHKKMVIDASEISKITQLSNSKAEIYTAKLLDGDLLIAQHYLDGKLKGEFDCCRYIKSKHCYPHMPELPVNGNYFHLLKEKYEGSQKASAQQELFQRLNFLLRGRIHGDGHYNSDGIHISPID